MERQLKKYLWDIIDAINFIEDHTAYPLTAEKFVNNRLIVAAVERKFEIIGEALKRVDNLYPELPITDKHRIIGMRNKIAHGYDEVEPIILWATIKKHLQILKSEIENLLRN